MRNTSFEKSRAVVAGFSLFLLVGCGVDSYLTDPSNVQCNGDRTQVNLAANGLAAFIVHGKHRGEVATIQVRRTEAGASTSVSGDVTGPPQKLESDGFTKPVPVGGGADLSAYAASGAWIIDVSKNTAVIQGSCVGM
jgi:hypothetical protein